MSCPYEIANIYLCHTDELLSHLYDLAILYIRIAAITFLLTRPCWRNGMETLYTLLVLCEENPLVIGGYPLQRASNVELSECQAA